MRLSILTITSAVLLAIGLISLVSVTQPSSSSKIPKEVQALFNEWKLSYAKSYGTIEDQKYRAEIFYQNYKKVSQLKKRVSHEVGLNKFADLTKEEFVAKYTGYSPNSQKITSTRPKSSRPVANGIDWREKGKVNPIKDQARCGSCWAFSAVQALESAWAIATGELVNLSEQELVDCSVYYGNLGCNGGYMNAAWDYAEAKGGLASQKEYPYTAKDGTCQEVKERLTTPQTYHNVYQTETDVSNAIFDGPVSAAIEADAESFRFYTGGVYFDPFCGKALNHAIGIVGYGQNDKQAYWIVRNSWGKTWGEDGYIRMRKDLEISGGTCGILLDVSYPEVEAQ